MSEGSGTDLVHKRHLALIRPKAPHVRPRGPRCDQAQDADHERRGTLVRRRAVSSGRRREQPRPQQQICRAHDAAHDGSASAAVCGARSDEALLGGRGPVGRLAGELLVIAQAGGGAVGEAGSVEGEEEEAEGKDEVGWDGEEGGEGGHGWVD